MNLKRIFRLYVRAWKEFPDSWSAVLFFPLTFGRTIESLGRSFAAAGFHLSTLQHYTRNQLCTPLCIAFITYSCCMTVRHTQMISEESLPPIHPVLSAILQAPAASISLWMVGWSVRWVEVGRLAAFIASSCFSSLTFSLSVLR